MAKYIIGNARQDGLDYRGWFVGNFIDKKRLNHSKDVEIKWDEPKKGTKRDEWSVNETAHTLTIIISGKQKVIFQDETFDLGPGEYFISEPGVPHKYEILEDALTISVRWPSIPKDHSNK